ncbi:RNA polymerase sigma factor SigZ [Cognaticolwellia mytili]|uniref:RNA polymerase sigma factor SigZ n=1 Tax=Cognaticolwellia mytili TaxID=1888913 RepID=UPI000A172B93|nr:RNA polymerase sigma factor SigZ [Cognaticolwellia mytili]
MNVESVWREYQASLKRFLHKNVANPDDVDDLLQDILLKSYQNLNHVNDIKKVKSWLFQIANNTIIDFYRKRSKHHQLENEVLWYSEQDESILQQLASCAVPFINALPKFESELLTAIEINGVSQKEYAQQHGIKYSTLKSRVQKSRKLLFGLYNNCCELSLDEHGNLIDFQEKSTYCKPC